ncbi:hypothetical protein GCM10023149_49050 [Mucilaginibacter gynuensis]|uniref:Uncharacterized protein n=1 Tax=Mucilaginibacter gynuensis TaxID=1302236 RepID=A0ABP8HGE6_9SPHI
MRGTQLTKYFTMFLLLWAMVITSCRKDDEISEETAKKSTTEVSDASVGNFLASKGTLKISIEDSTYTFDAATDSVAFVKVDTAGNQYFGISAINKAHTISFGISSLGVAENKSTTKVEGSQLLFKAGLGENIQYTLNQIAHDEDMGKLKLKQFNDKNVLAKGSFTTFLSKDTIKGSPLYKVTGSFDLKLK